MRLGPSARAALLATLAFGAFAGSATSERVLDDTPAIWENPVVRGVVPVREAFVRDSWGLRGPNGLRTFRPLQQLMFAAEYRVGGGDLRILHLVSALLHGLVVAAIYLVFRRLAPEEVALVAAAFAAVVAAPGEAVQSLVGRADVLLALFALLGLAAHRRPGARAAALAALCLAGAFLSKETAVFLPAAWLALDWILPPTDAQATLSRRVARFALYATLGLAWLLWRQHIFGTWRPPNTDALSNPLAVAALGPRVLGAGRMFAAHYLRGIIDPSHRLYMCSAPECGPAGPGDPVAWLGLALVAGLLWACLGLRRRAPIAAAGLAWFLTLFLPVSNLLAASSTPYAERLLYAPLIGLALLLGAGAKALASRTRPTLAYGTVAALCLGNLAAVQVRNLDWRSNAALYLSALNVIPKSAVVQCHAAHAWFERHDLARADHHATAALDLWPDLPECVLLLGRLREIEGRFDEADRLFTRALRLGPRPATVLACADYLWRSGQRDSAVQLIKDGLRRYPENMPLADRLATWSRLPAAPQ